MVLLPRSEQHICKSPPNSHFRWEIFTYVLFVTVLNEVKTKGILEETRFMHLFLSPLALHPEAGPARRGRGGCWVGGRANGRVPSPGVYDPPRLSVSVGTRRWEQVR